MIWFNSLADSNAVLVADTSVLINLIATGCTAEIFARLPCNFAVPRNVYSELENGTAKGHSNAEAINELFRLRHAQMLDLGPVGFSVYEKLIRGTTIGTLDDGEAAVIGMAIEKSGTALIDERKAKKLCAKSYPDLPIINTVEFLLSSNVKEILDIRRQAKAIRYAIKFARMHVPESYRDQVSYLLGTLDQIE